MPGGNRIDDALAVSNGSSDGRYRRYQIRHHDRPAIKLTGVRHDGLQHIIIA